MSVPQIGGNVPSASGSMMQRRTSPRATSTLMRQQGRCGSARQHACAATLHMPRRPARATRAPPAGGAAQPSALALQVRLPGVALPQPLPRLALPRVAHSGPKDALSWHIRPLTPTCHSRRCPSASGPTAGPASPHGSVCARVLAPVGRWGGARHASRSVRGGGAAPLGRAAGGLLPAAGRQREATERG